MSSAVLARGWGRPRAAGEARRVVQDGRARRTTILIAHPLSTIRPADRVVMLAAGRVVETGSHDELIACNGPCAELVTSQRGGLVGM